MAARAVTALAVFLIWIYRSVVSPILGPRCRFYPSCSEYSRQALKRHGLRAGGAMALGRIARCHPLSSGGYDPVSEKGD